MRIFFRVDGNSEIGVGHIRRCVVIAQQVVAKGGDAVFLVRCDDPSFLATQLPDRFETYSIPWGISPEDDSRLVIDLCKRKNLDCGVIDHYRLPVDSQKLLIESKIPWMQFVTPSLDTPIGADLLHEARPGASLGDYPESRFLKSQFEYLSGPDYSLISSEIASLRGRCPWSQRHSSLLTFGGGNDKGVSLQVIDQLEAINYPGELVVLTGSSNPNLEKLKVRCAGDSNLHLMIDNWSPAKVMSEARVAFCAGGTTLYELACLGVPAMIITIADNQVQQAMSWKEFGLGEHLGSLDDGFEIGRILDSSNKQKSFSEISKNASELIDGRGAVRTAECLMELASR